MFLKNLAIGTSEARDPSRVRYAASLWNNIQTTFRPSTNSKFVFDTAATTIYIEYIRTYNTVADVGLGVYVDGVAQAAPTLSTSRYGTVDILTYTLPAGQKRVELYTSSMNTAGVQPPKGTWVTGVQVDSGNSITVVSQPLATNRLIIYGDSICCGFTLTNAQYVGAAQLVERDYAGNDDAMVTEAWGYRTLYDDCSSAPLQAAFVTKLASCFPTDILLTIGRNDYALATQSAANFGVMYASLLDALNVSLPSCTLWCMSSIVQAVETANAFGDTLGAYRTQVSTAAAARPSFCTFVDGTVPLTTADLHDGIHPSQAGATLLANFWLALL